MKNSIKKLFLLLLVLIVIQGCETFDKETDDFNSENKATYTLDVSGFSNCILLDKTNATNTEIQAGAYAVSVTGNAYYASPASSENNYDNVFVMYSGSDNKNHFIALPIGSTKTLNIRNDGGGYVFFAFFTDWLGNSDNSGIANINIGSQIVSVNGKNNCILLDNSPAKHINLPAGTYTVSVTGNAYYASPASSDNNYDNVFAMYSGSDNKNHFIALPIGSTKTLNIRNDGGGYVFYAFFTDWLGYSDNSGNVTIKFVEQ